jgi:hypothetical protein
MGEYFKKDIMVRSTFNTAYEKNPENHSNVTLLGLYLRRKGYEHGDGRQRRCYKIALNSK